MLCTDECQVDSDCGVQGKCRMITHFSYPQRQCFCEPGWFGDKCQQGAIRPPVTRYSRHMYYIFALWFLFSFFFLLFFFFSSPILSGRRLDVYHTSTHGVALVRIYNAGLKCAACGSPEIQDTKIAICTPSHNFVGLYLRN